MREIKAYLTNRKDIYMAAFLQELQKEQPNLGNAKFYLDLVVAFDFDLKQLKDGKENKKN